MRGGGCGDARRGRRSVIRHMGTGGCSDGKRTATERRGEVFDEAANDKRVEAVEHWAEERSKGLFATSRVSDDGMIDPRDTRTVLGIALSACHNKAVKGTKEFGTWRM